MLGERGSGSEIYPSLLAVEGVSPYFSCVVGGKSFVLCSGTAASAFPENTVIIKNIRPPQEDLPLSSKSYGKKDRHGYASCGDQKEHLIICRNTSNDFQPRYCLVIAARVANEKC